MKTTVATRFIDELGRVVLPIEIRKRMCISDGEALEIALEDDVCTIRKKVNACIFCGAPEENLTFKDKAICKACLAELTQN